MGDFTKGQFGTYTVTADLASRDPGVTEGDDLVFLPTSVDDEGAASGVAYTQDGRPIQVVIPAEKPEEPMPTQAPSGVNARDWEAFQQFRAEQDNPKQANPTPEPAATAQEPDVAPNPTLSHAPEPQATDTATSLDLGPNTQGDAPQGDATVNTVKEGEGQ